MTDDKLLRIYLNDHLAASKGGHELAKRALGNNEGTRFAPALQRLVEEIDDERDQLARFIDRVGGSPDPLKQGAAWVAEKLGRLKLNGRLTGYSPLSRVIELEGMSVGIEAKVRMWQALRQVAETDPRIEPDVVDDLIEKGLRQRDDMEEARREAVREAFLDQATQDA